MSSSSSIDEDGKRLIDKQAALSAGKTPVEEADGEASSSKAEAHLQHQREVFDDMSDFFASEEATPPHVRPLLANLMGRALQGIQTSHKQHAEWMKTFMESRNATHEPPNEETIRILDVGCGTGALWPFLVEAASAGAKLEITGVDLSPQMIAKAKERVNRMNFKESDHNVELLCGDFVALATKEGGDDASSLGKADYDAVIINACFGNFFDTDALVKAASSCLRSDTGMMFVTHPLGAAFVEKLRQEDAATVPHPLPPSLDTFNTLVRRHGMEAQDFVQELQGDGDHDSAPIYFATARKTPYVLLPNIIKLRGPVAHGYGRGGKQLGFPTANLPSSLFAQALEDVPAGIYVGWAVVENPPQEDNATIKGGRNVFQKAVVNVGYSPTFVGAENKEKIVEAYLMVGPDEGAEHHIEEDFYGEVMRLALLAYIRPEKKFASLPELIHAINMDVYMAETALGTRWFRQFLDSDFVTGACGDGGSAQQTTTMWIGKDGGTESASWEFESLMA